MFDKLDIRSPRRQTRASSAWERFFPYYAGYSQTFAFALLNSVRLDDRAVVSDPWNGSGTTTYAASRLGIRSLGSDLNPVMVVMARARLLPPSEADSLEPLGQELVTAANSSDCQIFGKEPLSVWFSDRTAAMLRAIERGIQRLLVGRRTLTTFGPHLDQISGLAATFYAALFNVCRELAVCFRASNPTWLRRPKSGEPRIDVPSHAITERLLSDLAEMAAALKNGRSLVHDLPAQSEIKLADATETGFSPDSVDLVLSSPPYCTRIDYTAATRIELAVLHPLLQTTPEELSRRMVGSVRVPPHEIDISPLWGEHCGRFLKAVRDHPSKASSGYYYKTHLDYFDKMSRSLQYLSRSLKKGGIAILVVRDSYYKNLHNDLPRFMIELAEASGLQIQRRDDFRITHSMSGINLHSRRYQPLRGSIESVLCLGKQ